MTNPMRSDGFGDLIDPRFQEIFDEKFKQLPDMIPTLFSHPPDNGRADMRWSETGAFGDFEEFSGTVDYDSVAQGFDTIATHVEFARGFQIERKLFDDDQYQIMNGKPAGLAKSAQRTRQKHAARVFNLASSVDTKFYNRSEAVALVSASHTTNATNVSTAVGFDNLVTTALTATSLTAARIQMVGFVDDRANLFSVIPDEIWIPNDLYDVAYEIVASMGAPEDANNARNVHEGAYTINEWNYMTDTNNWFLSDSSARKESLFWVDRVPIEFAFAEDLDTIIAKWRAYQRYSWAPVEWRWILGAIVS